MDTNYFLDLTKEVAKNAGKDLKLAIASLKTDAEKANEKAAKEAADIKEILDEYKNQQSIYLQKMTDVETEIRAKEQDIDLAVLDISADCIAKCKTITIPDVEYSKDCAKATGHSIPCLQWSENKDKVVNVNCLVKCEAKKISSSNSAYGDLKDIRTLLNRYKELKTLVDNLQPLIALLEKGDDIAEDTKAMLEKKTDIKGALTSLSAKSDDQLISISKLVVDSPIRELSQPCLPFDFDFVLHTQPSKESSGKHDICFNGEFLKNVGTEILKASFPTVNAMYKALEEAEMRYVKLNGIKKSLAKAKTEMTEDSASRRSSIPDGIGLIEDAIQARLFKTAKRTLPRFTVKGDRTVMGFVHYSPWALLARSNPFSTIDLPDEAESYNHRKVNGSSCQQARYVVGQYRDIIHGLHSISNSYRRGKVIYQNYRQKVNQELKDSYDELRKLGNKTALRPEELKDMFYWYDYTRAGMNEWLGGLSERLVQHNKRAMSFWNAEMKGIYGEASHLDSLADIGHDAYARSNIGQKAKSTSSNVLHNLRNEIKTLMKNSSITLEEVSPILGRLNVNVESLHKSSVSCY